MLKISTQEEMAVAELSDIESFSVYITYNVKEQEFPICMEIKEKDPRLFPRSFQAIKHFIQFYRRDIEIPVEIINNG